MPANPVRRLVVALRRGLALVIAVLALGAALPATAQTLTTNATGGTIGLSDAQSIVGEVATPLAPQILNYSLWVGGFPNPIAFRPVIYEWNGSTVVGGPLYTGAVQTAPAGSVVQHVFSPNITLDPAKQYVFAVERTIPGQTGSVEYNIQNADPGHAVIFTSAWVPDLTAELRFTATFGPPPPAPVPTMTEWALILLGLVLAGGAVLTLHRRRLTV